MVGHSRPMKLQSACDPDRDPTACVLVSMPAVEDDELPVVHIQPPINKNPPKDWEQIQEEIQKRLRLGPRRSGWTRKADDKVGDGTL